MGPKKINKLNKYENEKQSVVREQDKTVEKGVQL